MAKLKTGRALSSAALNYLSEQYGGEARGRMKTVVDGKTKTRVWEPNPSAKSADQEIMEAISTPDELAKDMAGIGRTGVTGKKGLRAQMRDEKNPTLIKSEDLTTEQQDKEAQKMAMVKELVSEITSGLSTYQNRKEGKFPVVRRLEKMLATKTIAELNDLAKAYSEGKMHVLDGKPTDMPKVKQNANEKYITPTSADNPEERQPEDVKQLMKWLRKMQAMTPPKSPNTGVQFDETTNKHLRKMEGASSMWDDPAKWLKADPPPTSKLTPEEEAARSSRRAKHGQARKLREANADEFLTEAEKAAINQALSGGY